MALRGPHGTPGTPRLLAVLRGCVPLDPQRIPGVPLGDPLVERLWGPLGNPRPQRILASNQGLHVLGTAGLDRREPRDHAYPGSTSGFQGVSVGDTLRPLSVPFLYP